MQQGSMVYLAFTAQGAREAVEACVATKGALWVASDCLLAPELQAIRARGIAVNEFLSLSSAATPEEIQDAVAALEQQHPSETIWVQHDPRRL